MPSKASENYTTIYQVIHFWWLRWDNLDAGFLFLTHSDIKDDDHSPPSAFFFLGIIPLLFQICSSTFCLSVAWPVHMYKTTLWRKTNHSGLVLEDKENTMIPLPDLSKQKAFHGSSAESTRIKMEPCRSFSLGYVLRSTDCASHLTHWHVWYPLNHYANNKALLVTKTMSKVWHVTYVGVHVELSFPLGPQLVLRAGMFHVTEKNPKPLLRLFLREIIIL